MAYLPNPKNSNLGKFRRVLKWKMEWKNGKFYGHSVYVLYGHLVYLVAI
jgi:hypothetical protein